MHEQLSTMFAQRGDGPREAWHAIRAGRALDGIDALARYAAASCAATDADPEAYLRFLEDTPDNWREIYGEALALAASHRRRKHVEYTIRTRLTGILVHSSGSSDGHFEALTHALADDAGLNILASLDASMPAGERLKLAIGQAFARHRSRPDAEQVLDPSAALQQLARALTTASGHVANSMDFELWWRLPSLRPVAPLSPALAVVATLAEGADARFAGKFAESRRIFVDLLARMAPPNDVGLAQSYADGIRVGVGTVVGLYAALLGDRSWERAAQEVSVDAIHSVNALLVRGLGELWDGNVLESDRIESERRLRRLEQRRPQAYEGLSVLWRFTAYVACEDLTRTRNGLDDIERFASRSLTWEPAAIWARAEYERIRGDHGAALTYIDEALARMQPGRHLLWASAATSRLLVLTSLGREAESASDGERYILAAGEAKLDHVRASLHLATALACAKRTDALSAWAHVDSAFEILETHAAGGLRLGLAFEVAASVAIHLRDSQAFERYALGCRDLYLAHDNAALATKYERLLRAANRAALVANFAVLWGALVAMTAQLLAHVEQLLETSTTPRTAIEAALGLIAAEVGARSGFIYTMVDRESALVAQVGAEVPSDELGQVVHSRLLSEHDDDLVTGDADDEHSGAWLRDASGNTYQSVVLGHAGKPGFVVNGLMILVGGRQLLDSGPLAIRLSEFLQASGGARS
jgi:hypothetical protein